jgi:hypothetical protein
LAVGLAGILPAEEYQAGETPGGCTGKMPVLRRDNLAGCRVDAQMRRRLRSSYVNQSSSAPTEERVDFSIDKYGERTEEKEEWRGTIARRGSNAAMGAMAMCKMGNGQWQWQWAMGQWGQSSLLTHFERFQEPFAVHIVAKDFFAAITSAHQMINGSLILNAQLPRHAHH